MTKKELIKAMEHFSDDSVVIIMDAVNEGWDNICKVNEAGSQIAIYFGGSSPFSSE
jgi:hypothetical protein